MTSIKIPAAGHLIIIGSLLATRGAVGALARAMAPYAESFRKLSAKSGDLQGFPLRTRFRFACGGALRQASRQ